MKNQPEITVPGRTGTGGSNGGVTPEIAPPGNDSATSAIPVEMPGRGGPGTPGSVPQITRYQAGQEGSAGHMQAH